MDRPGRIGLHQVRSLHMIALTLAFACRLGVCNNITLKSFN